MCLAAVPLLTRIKKTLVNSSLSKRSDISTVHSYSIASTTTTYMLTAITFIGLGGGTDIFTLPKITTRRELIRACIDAPWRSLGVPGNTDSQIIFQLGEIFLISIMMKVDPTPAFTHALSTERVLTFTTRITRDALAAPSYARIPGAPVRSMRGALDWIDSVALIWRQIMARATGQRLEGPVIEMVETNLLFLLEIWSISASSHMISMSIYRYQHFDTLSYSSPPVTDHIMGPPIPKWFTVLNEKKHKSILHRASRQIQIITTRISRAPGLRPKVVNAWNNWRSEFERIIPLKSNMEACGRIGCESLREPELKCARCKFQIYCTRECQKR